MEDKPTQDSSIWKEEWKQEPYVDTTVLGKSIWVWLTALYYVWAIIFTIIIVGQDYPTTTKILQLIITYGVGVNGIVASYYSEILRKGGGEQ
jgi:hypothetical protein